MTTKKEIRPVYMVYPGLFPLLMLNYWLRRSDIPIVGILISGFDIKKKDHYFNFFELCMAVYQQSGFWYMIYILVVAKFGVQVTQLWNFLRKLRGKKIKIKTFDQIAKEYGIPVLKLKDFNGPEAKAFLKNVNGNLIVSSYNNQILKKTIFNVPEFKAINIHASMLPNFRGLDPTFEAMYHGVTHCGATIHFVDSKIDTGEILVQGRVRIRKEDTLFFLAARCWVRGARLLDQVLHMFETGTVRSRKQDPREIKYPYQSFPIRSRVAEFHVAGKKLFSWRDLKNTFK